MEIREDEKKRKSDYVRALKVDPLMHLGTLTFNFFGVFPL